MDYSYLIKFGIYREETKDASIPLEPRQTMIKGFDNVLDFLRKLPKGSDIYELVNLGDVADVNLLLEDFKNQNKPNGLVTGEEVNDDTK